MKMAVLWVVAPWSLVDVYQHFKGTCCLHQVTALMMEAASTSRISVNFYQTTWCYNPDAAIFYIISMRMFARNCITIKKSISCAVSWHSNLIPSIIKFLLNL
jgi:predicted transcriptional regulator